MLKDLSSDASSQSGPESLSDGKRIGHFRQILLWPVQLISNSTATAPENPAEVLAQIGENNPWQEVKDEFTGDPREFQERHYNEFVAFLPPVQRFLYGSGRSRVQGFISGESPIIVMRRNDVAALRVKLSKDAAPLDLKIAHIDLYFFFEIDIAIMALEIYADDINLADAQDLMFRLGRAYPSYWEPDGSAGHCPYQVDIIAHDGRILATSDYNDRQKYLTFVCENRSARVASHWEYLLSPMVPHHSTQRGPLRYTQLEAYRMPQMGFLAIDRNTALTREDYVRLAFASGTGDREALPFSDSHLVDFERRYCYDRYFQQRCAIEWPESRYLSCGHTLVVTGNRDDELFVNIGNGCLNSFRHEHFLLFMIAHFHKAALIMFSDRLTEAMSKLDVRDLRTVQSFRQATRFALETFLRFTHRYWFHVVSNQPLIHDLFALVRSHLDMDRLYEDIRLEVHSMSDFLENEALRKQNDGMTRLTVVTTLGLIGTTVTGFLGMNLFSWSEEPAWWRVLAFFAVLIPTILLTMVTMARSRRLAEFMDVLSQEATSLRAKVKAFWKVWRF